MIELSGVDNALSSGCYTAGDALMEPKIIGRYIVTDPEICHGKPTFRGTRILVADVLEQVAEGLAWETIVAEWRGSLSRKAIDGRTALAH
jgi:uncharacterized protein (DUF433 family)